MRYTEVKSSADLSKYLDMYRGRGVSTILINQLGEDMNLDDAHAFSSFGDFLNIAAQYHANSKVGNQITDDVVFNEIKELLNRMVKDPKYSDYHEFLEDKLAELQQSQT